MMMTKVTKLTMMLMTIHVMMPMINKYNDDKVHSLAAMEAGIVTMALTNPLQVFLSTLSASKWENLWDLLVNK